MAYAKSEKVQAQIDKRRDKFVTAAIAFISIYGIEALTTDKVAARAGMSVGLIYKHFPDKVELIAAAVQQMLDADLDAMREAVIDITDIEMLSSALAVFYSRMQKPRLVHALIGQPIYQAGIRNHITALIRRALSLPPKQATVAAASSLGALYGVFCIGDGTRSSVAVLHALRAIGVGDAAARRVAA